MNAWVRLLNALKMIAKIIQGGGFAGAVGYVMEKKDARLLAGEGVILNDTESIIQNFIC